MPAGKGRYTIGRRGTHGCSGYPVVGGEGKVHGCHPTREAAQNQQAAIYASQSKKDITSYDDFSKAWSVIEGHSECSGSFAAVGDSGTVHGCFDTKEEADAAVRMHNQNHNDNNDSNHYDDMNKAKKPNYGEMIKPRSGGSEPANARLYAQILREAKDRFDVYPSAVANSWVVQEYKRRGGTYKTKKEVTKSIWSGGFLDFKGLK